VGDAFQIKATTAGSPSAGRGRNAPLLLLMLWGMQHQPINQRNPCSC
jgi:hypothetical protein